MKMIKYSYFYYEKEREGKTLVFFARIINRIFIPNRTLLSIKNGRRKKES